MGAKSEFFHISFPQQFFFNRFHKVVVLTSFLVIRSLFRLLLLVVFLRNGCLLREEKKWDIVNHPSGLHNHVIIPI